MAAAHRPGDVPRGLPSQLWFSLRAALVSVTPAEPADGAAARVLDCGGGTGSVAVPLAVEGAQVTVVDVSIDALGTLMRRATEAGVADRVFGVQGEVESLTALLSNDAFDLLIAHDVLGDVLSVPEAFAQMTAMLRPGGVASIVVGNPVAVVLSRVLSGDAAGALQALRHGDGDGSDPGRYVDHCARAGLRVERVEGVGVFRDFVSGSDAEGPVAAEALAELEAATAQRSPYRDIAARVHIVARKLGPGTADR